VPITPVFVSASVRYTVAAYIAGAGGSRRAYVGSWPKTRGNVRLDGVTYVSTAYAPDARPTALYFSSSMYGQADVQFAENTCTQVLWCADADGDGVPGATCNQACSAPSSKYVQVSAAGTDCNDADASIYPGAPELCDMADNDCDAAVNEAICGDGAVQACETCDDGNLTNGDGCSSSCLIDTRTMQDFDTPGTTYTMSASGSCFGTVLTDSATDNDFLRLSAKCGGNAAVGFDRTNSGAPSRVTAEFDFRITGAYPRADGMSIALMSTANYGASGAPYFGEEPNLIGSIGIGFDVYRNYGEPNGNHISLHWNGASINVNSAPGFDLYNGMFNHARLVVDFVGGNAIVTLIVTPNGGAPFTIFNAYSIANVAPYESRVGFGARIGGYSADHDVDNVAVAYE
jgi:cysteine-rich repeat protein